MNVSAGHGKPRFVEEKMTDWVAEMCGYRMWRVEAAGFSGLGNHKLIIIIWITSMRRKARDVSEDMGRKSCQEKVFLCFTKNPETYLYLNKCEPFAGF